MKECDYITLIEHKELFDDENITNSNLIETYIPYIKNLSEHFIYMNDDFFILKKLNYTDFFTSEGKAIVPKTKYSKMYIIKNKLNYNLPLQSGFYLHVPINIIKSEAIKYQKKYPEYINFVRSIKNRELIGCDVCFKNLLKCPCQQQHYPIANFMLNNNKAIEKNYNNTYLYWRISKFKNNKKYKIEKKYKYLCINNDMLSFINKNNKNNVIENFNNFASSYFYFKPKHEK